MKTTESSLMIFYGTKWQAILRLIKKELAKSVDTNEDVLLSFNKICQYIGFYRRLFFYQIYQLCKLSYIVDGASTIIYRKLIQIWSI